jgi:hypothetical protein
MESAQLSRRARRGRTFSPPAIDGKCRPRRTGFPLKKDNTPPVPYAQRLKTFLSLGGRLRRNVCLPIYGLTSSAPVSTTD